MFVTHVGHATPSARSENSTRLRAAHRPESAPRPRLLPFRALWVVRCDGPGAPGTVCSPSPSPSPLRGGCRAACSSRRRSRTPPPRAGMSSTVVRPKAASDLLTPKSGKTTREEQSLFSCRSKTSRSGTPSVRSDQVRGVPALDVDLHLLDACRGPRLVAPASVRRRTSRAPRSSATPPAVTRISAPVMSASPLVDAAYRWADVARSTRRHCYLIPIPWRGIIVNRKPRIGGNRGNADTRIHGEEEATLGASGQDRGSGPRRRKDGRGGSLLHRHRDPDQRR